MLPSQRERNSVKGHIPKKQPNVTNPDGTSLQSQTLWRSSLTPHLQQALMVFLSGSNYTHMHPASPGNCILGFGWPGHQQNLAERGSFLIYLERGISGLVSRESEDIFERTLVTEEGWVRRNGVGVGVGGGCSAWGTQIAKWESGNPS